MNKARDCQCACHSANVYAFHEGSNDGCCEYSRHKNGVEDKPNLPSSEDGLRKQIYNCFKSNLMQVEGDTELFDTTLTIDLIQKLVLQRETEARKDQAKITSKWIAKRIESLRHDLGSGTGNTALTYAIDQAKQGSYRTLADLSKSEGVV